MSSSKLFFLFLLALSATVSTVKSEEHGITEMQTEHLTYKWTINQFSLLPQQFDEYIESPIFGTENRDVEWSLRLYPRGSDDEYLEYVSLYLQLISQKADKIDVKAHYRLSILKSGNIIQNYTYDYTFNEIMGYGEIDFILRSELLNVSSPDDTFTISAEIDMPIKMITVPLDITDSPEQKILRDLQRNQLGEDFAPLLGDKERGDELYDNEMDSDKMDGDLLFFVRDVLGIYVHKVIFAARSPVFAKMIEDGIPSIQIDDMNEAEGYALREFIYTDYVTDLEPMAGKLLAAADRYEMPRLKTMCENALYESLNVDNAVNILILTDLHHSYELKKHVMDFINRHFSVVMNTPEYRNMTETAPLLLQEFLEYSSDCQDSQTEL